MKDKLLISLACPKCHGQLQYDTEQQQLICQIDKCVYTVKDGIPVLLATEAKSLPQ